MLGPRNIQSVCHCLEPQNWIPGLQNFVWQKLTAHLLFFLLFFNISSTVNSLGVLSLFLSFSSSPMFPWLWWWWSSSSPSSWSSCSLWSWCALWSSSSSSLSSSLWCLWLWWLFIFFVVDFELLLLLLFDRSYAATESKGLYQRDCDNSASGMKSMLVHELIQLKVEINRDK